MSRKIGVAAGLLLGLLGVGIGAYFLFFFNPAAGNDVVAADFPPLGPVMAEEGPYLIIASQRARDEYAEAMAVARELHPGALEAILSPGDPEALLPELKAAAPRFALIFLLPDELDANTAWAWLRTAARVDDDPFVDVSTGYVTGATPADALAFMQRIKEAADGEAELPAMLVDHLAANPSADPAMFQRVPGSFFLTSFQGRLEVQSISCGVRGFGVDRLDSMNGAGILHFGGHGYPDRIVDTLNAAYVTRLALSPCVVFNGACYTGVTGRWFDMTSGVTEQQHVSPELSFCLGMLRNPVVGYLAALHADHGIPVYQEMEYMASSGAPLGDVMKHTHDGLVLANGGALPEFPGFAAGDSPAWTPAQIMIYGTGTRVLFGDPALVVAPAFTGPPFAVESSLEGDALLATCTLANSQLRATYTDTYFADLAYPAAAFNDRALLAVPLPADWDLAYAEVEVVSVAAAGGHVPHRIVGQAVERWDGQCLLHVQVDFPASGYMVSDFRNPGSAIALRVTRE